MCKICPSCFIHLRNPTCYSIIYITKFILWEYFMFKITDACVNCGACEPDCPVGAISESNDARIIDQDKCISCGTCVADCPADAIIEE